MTAPGLLIDPHVLAALHRWMGHVLLLLKYQPPAVRAADPEARP